ncbi:MAG: hypothetical protein ABI852_09680 [Gemmatimonadaceae bacterium]
MKNKRLLTLSVFACALGTAGTASAQDQITEVARTPIANATQITFGYMCDDRFVIRNDDTKAVELEYGLEKGNAHTRLTLNGRETVELASKSKAAMELWMDGKMVAKARKENRSCKDVQGNGAVRVTPLEVSSNDDARSRNAYGFGFGYGFSSPFYDPWGYGYYNSFGIRPYYSRVIAYPVIINRGGGRGRR